MGDVNDDDFWAFWDATVGGGDDGAHQTEGTPVVAGEGGGQTSAAAGLEGQTSGAHQTEEDDRNKAQIGEDDQPMLEASMDVVYELDAHGQKKDIEAPDVGMKFVTKETV
ncbi:unnamed protein product [Cuscuta epithymum]|uniref:Uncharacterized protein n=1 Tax=Cuscuta epithymum TaxID=186058 RepID=A0AAV0DYR3_9ASTE|nr:unnamed protein product [Cuscuta epithymum]